MEINPPGALQKKRQTEKSTPLEDLRAFRFESSFGSWLYRLATNTCLNALRSRRARRETERVRIETHLDGCERRRECIRQIRQRTDLARQAPLIEPPDEVWSDRINITWTAFIAGARVAGIARWERLGARS